MAKRPRRFVLVGDTHGDMIDRDAEAEFFRWLDEFKPDIRIHMGDAFDFRALRRGASDEEAAEGLRDDIDAGKEFLSRLKPDVWLMGNHDDRITRMANHSLKQMQREYAGMLWDEIRAALPRKTKVIPYNVETGLCRVADMVCIHGYQCNLTTARWIAMHYGGGGVRRVVQGHVHAFQQHTARVRGGTVGHAIGGLCRRVMDYNKMRPATLAHENGWAYGEIINGRTTFNEYRVARELEAEHVVC